MDLLALALELDWSSRTQTGRTGEGEAGIKKEIWTGATTHLLMRLGSGSISLVGQ